MTISDVGVSVVPETRRVLVEIDFTAQMLTTWPEILDRTREVAQAHEVPEGHKVIDASHRLVRIATSHHPGLMVWQFTTLAPLEID